MKDSLQELATVFSQIAEDVDPSNKYQLDAVQALVAEAQVNPKPPSELVVLRCAEAELLDKVVKTLRVGGDVGLEGLVNSPDFWAGRHFGFRRGLETAIPGVRGDISYDQSPEFGRNWRLKLKLPNLDGVVDNR